ncbi:HAMP domain-containing sensor histidine kinase [Streptacidiphilus sp. N1-10]|uniref:histidine kinase n=1 Tax=Streptacidiphilus jeojiensis TaxID=3229225 RepID=A0ABV6XGY7_9ACTN
MTADRPAVARLHRMRWSMTLLYAACSAACLIALVFIAAAIDTRSRAHSLDSEVAGHAEALSRAVWMDQGVLHLEPLSEDELAGASTVTAVIQRSGNSPVRVRWVRPSSGTALPAPAGLDALWAATVRTQTTYLDTVAAADGRKLRWAAAPVWDADDIGAVVLTAIDPGPREQSHQELLRWLAAGCAALVLVSAGTGHLLSGRSMRPALRALDQQEQFLAEAAHELRTPLATLRLVLEAGSAAPDRSAPATPEAVRLVDHMGRLVAGLLVRARIEAGSRELELTPLRLDQLVEQVVDELPDDGAEVTVRTEPTVVRGDPDLLAQAVRNLIENALRHGAAADRAASVQVEVAAGTVRVRDHGPGIAAAERERIFGERVAGRPGGTGIGLAIVRWVAELHGGTADATEAPGGGALLTLAIPEHTPS